MSRFRFRLEKILAWERTQRDVEEARLKQCNAALAHANSELAQMRAGRLATELEVRGFEALAGNDLRALAAYGLLMEKREAQQIRDCQACAGRVEAQRKKWVEAERRCQLLEKLKERKRAEFEREQDREAENLASELFLAKWPVS